MVAKSVDVDKTPRQSVASAQSAFLLPVKALLLFHSHSSDLVVSDGEPARPTLPPGRYLFLLVAVMSTACLSGTADADDTASGLQAPDGFEVSLFADDDLAHDIYSLTVDSHGRVVVAGRGYVRILTDTNSDGTADSATQFADTPANGSMGLYWDGPDLICTGDAGLLRYRDADGDDHADGPPELLLNLKTGGEHDVHAIRKGPDGWWYLLGGNGAELDKRYVTLASSPVRSPVAGALLRLTPDFSASEIVADGFRNPYDFDFGPAGSIFTYDSDGERDVSLPWYRPTRVFEILAGSHAGWVSRNWKRPDEFFDMPPVAAAFGRGSPTGVECYRHTQFPPEYRGGLFVLDWTYGRVLFVPHATADGDPPATPPEFLTGVGSFGFAPTDAAIGPDGSLYVSVGGRGTRGGVYRIRWSKATADDWPQDPLDACLNAPQPLSSWSRARWEPLADQLGGEPFRGAAVDEQRSVAERVRAIEILTERFDGLDERRLQLLVKSPEPDLRARTAWMIGRMNGTNSEVLLDLLPDRHPAVVRAALEAVLTVLPEGRLDGEPFVRSMSAAASHPDRFVRAQAGRVLSRVSEATFDAVCETASKSDWPAQITIGYAASLRQSGFSPDALTRSITVLQNDSLSGQQEAARLAQLALGDVGPGAHLPVFDGYASPVDLGPFVDELQPLVETVHQVFPSSDAYLNTELGRLLAILQPPDAAFLDDVLAQLTAESSPVDDVHWLIVASRLPAARTDRQTLQIASALLSLDRKIDERSLPRDSNWDDRITEMFAALTERDPRLFAAVVGHPDFGAPGHVLFAASAPVELQEQAIDAVVLRITASVDFAWSTDVVALLASSQRSNVRDLLRGLAEDFGLKSAVLLALAAQPEDQDRPLYLDGLQSADLGVIRAMVDALASLKPDDTAAIQVALVRTLRRLESSDAERRLKQSILRQLERNANRPTPANLSEDQAIDDWTRWIEDQFPEEWTADAAVPGADAERVQQQLGRVDWTQGDATRGARLFEKRSCHQCHGNRNGLGPDLTGVAQRFSRDDLFAAIAQPSKDVPPRYQATLIVTDEGHAHTGIVVYESIDGLLLRNAQGQTVRIEADDIDVRRRLTESLMPTGLLNDLQPADLADLSAYLKTLTP